MPPLTLKELVRLFDAKLHGGVHGFELAEVSENEFVDSVDVAFTHLLDANFIALLGGNKVGGRHFRL